jgi:hypothetical protein
MHLSLLKPPAFGWSRAFDIEVPFMNRTTIASVIMLIFVAAGLSATAAVLQQSGKVAATPVLLDALMPGGPGLNAAAHLRNRLSVPRMNHANLFLEAPQYTAGLKPAGVAIGDFDGDGKQDLAVANIIANINCQSSPCTNPGSVSVLLGKGDGSFRKHVDYPTGLISVAVAVGDFNNDGKLDIVVANEGSNTVSVLLGNGDGTFQAHVDYATGQLPDSVAVGDFNGDGNLDIAVSDACGINPTCRGHGGASILLGKGDGTFQPHRDYKGGVYPESIAIGDFNGDGKLDLVMANNCGNLACLSQDPSSVSVLLGNGDGSFQSSKQYEVVPQATSVAVTDLNGDGKTDLVVADGGVSVLLGRGDGTFRKHIDYSTAGGSVAVAIGDFNGDGKPDLATANYDGGGDSVSVLLGDGHGAFQPAVNYGVGIGPVALAVGVFKGSANSDLAVANSNCSPNSYSPCRPPGSVSVMLGHGDGTFHAPLDYVTGVNPASVAVGDFNRDRNADIAISNLNDNTVSVLLGNGNGSFHAPVDYGVLQPLGLAVGDFRNDGVKDLAVANYLETSSTVSILLGNRDGTFQPPVKYDTGSFSYAVAVGDFNGDDNLDLAVTNSGSNTVSVLLGKGDGTFWPQVQSHRLQSGRSDGGGFQPRWQARSRCGQRLWK